MPHPIRALVDRRRARHLADVRLIAFWEALGADVRRERAATTTTTERTTP
jgi:hypothetical protein